MKFSLWIFAVLICGYSSCQHHPKRYKQPILKVIIPYFDTISCLGDNSDCEDMSGSIIEDYLEFHPSIFTDSHQLISYHMFVNKKPDSTFKSQDQLEPFFFSLVLDDSSKIITFRHKKDTALHISNAKTKQIIKIMNWNHYTTTIDSIIKSPKRHRS